MSQSLEETIKLIEDVIDNFVEQELTPPGKEILELADYLRIIKDELILIEENIRLASELGLEEAKKEEHERISE